VREALQQTITPGERPMPDVLIIFASNHGHTGKIALRLTDVIEREGATVHLRSADAAHELYPSDYDAVVVGASIHAGRYQRKIVDWARTHARWLNEMPAAFFSVCLAAAEDTDQSREESTNYLDDFQDDTGWTPRKRITFAGAVEYREYGLPTRLFMRALMRQKHQPTDTSRDIDHTDWEAVDRFAHECAAMAATAQTEAAGAGR
jgi:menaquinone-dependent protoporphyrinogen oxidase